MHVRLMTFSAAKAAASAATNDALTPACYTVHISLWLAAWLGG